MSGEEELSLLDAVYAALPLSVRAAGFVTATHIVCSKDNYDGFTLLPDLRLIGVFDELGPMMDRSPESAAAYEALIETDLHLNLLPVLDDRIEPRLPDYITSEDVTFWFVDDTTVPDHYEWPAAELEDLNDAAIASSLDGSSPYELGALLRHIDATLAVDTDGNVAEIVNRLGREIQAVWPDALEIELVVDEGGDSGRMHLRVNDVIGPAGSLADAWGDDYDTLVDIADALDLDDLYGHLGEARLRITAGGAEVINRAG